MVCQVNNVVVAIKKRMINSFLVETFIVDQPNAIEPVHPAVIAHPKDRTNFSATVPVPRLARHANNRKWWNRNRS
jgi:hypothetical protein